MSDPDLRACARKGHVTYRPDEPELCARLTVTTPLGQTWRCLRCGTFVLGEPKGSGPASAAPQVLRGRALRDARVLRLLAAERLIRALLLTLFGYAILRFETDQQSVQTLFDQAVPAAKPLARIFDYNLDSSPTVTKIRHLLGTSRSTLNLVAVLLFAYAATQVVEGVGLALLKRWGEYVAATVTALFLPFEVYELTERITVVRFIALAINLAAVFYLVFTKRLFGLRGGVEAYEAQRASASLLEVEQAGSQSRVGRMASDESEADDGTAGAGDATMSR